MTLHGGAGPVRGEHYLEATPETVRWGWLPDATSAPVLTIDSGQTVTIDTVSHEGILEDQGRDPVAWFAQFGVVAQDVANDAVTVAREVPHTWGVGGGHVVTGPVHVTGAQPGDLLEVEVLDLIRRTEYGVISNRHGRGALPGEFPLGPLPDPRAKGWAERYRTVSHFCRVQDEHGVLEFGRGRARFPLAPFLGIMGVARAGAEPVHSGPPGLYGGNLDVRVLGAGSRLYLPVQVEGAGFATGDPHFAQGDGEVAVTALEAPLRATVRLTVLRGAAAAAAVGTLHQPFGETATHWVPIGLDGDLREAMRAAVRAAVEFLSSKVGMDQPAALAYLSAAGDFAVSQVVDGVQGVHCMIRKSDFSD